MLKIQKIQNISISTKYRMFKISQNVGRLKLKNTGYSNSEKYRMLNFPQRTKRLKFHRIQDV
jgi:hypothetical protein